MKNRFMFFVCLVSFGAVFASCNKSLPDVAVPEGPSQVVFTAEGFDAAVSTRAAEVSSLSSFYCLATTGTPGAAAETTSPGFASTQFTASGANFTGGQYWPATNPSYHFYAASKALSLSSGNVTFAPGTTITDDVYAYLASPTYKNTNALTFNHIYAQVGSCNISAPSGYTISGLTVKITPNLPSASSTFNVRTGTWGGTPTTGSAVTLCSATGSTTDNDLWLIPGTYTLTAAYTISKGAYSETLTKEASVTLVMGRNNNITATLPEGNAADVVFTVSVTPWSNNSITATFN